MGGFGALSVNIGGEKRGVKREITWLNAETAAPAFARSVIRKKQVVGELIFPTPDMWRTKDSREASTSWADTDDLN